MAIIKFKVPVEEIFKEGFYVGHEHLLRENMAEKDSITQVIEAKGLFGVQEFALKEIENEHYIKQQTLASACLRETIVRVYGAIIKDDTPDLLPVYCVLETESCAEKNEGVLFKLGTSFNSDMRYVLVTKDTKIKIIGDIPDVRR